MQVGTVVTLKVHCLGNRAGSLGVCYEKYVIGGLEGHSFIFQNGDYDGFSPDEVVELLDVVGMIYSCAGYQFKNVIQLSRDFKNGVFSDAFSGAVS